MSGVRVIELESSREPDYSAFLQDHPAPLITYSLRYRDMLCELLGCEPHYAIAVADERIVGILPLMSFLGKFGRVLNSLPYFGSNGGALATEPGVRRQLNRWYEEQMERGGVVASTVIGNPLLGADEDLASDLTDFRIGHVTTLPGGEAEDKIRALIEGSARRNIAKAERSGVRVSVENDNFTDLEALHRDSMLAIGGQVKEPRFFAAVPRHFRPDVDFKLYLARIDGEPAAALLVFYCGRTADYYVPAAGPAYRDVQPMAAILYRALTDAANAGLTYWNWGGSWPSQESLQRFKRKWSGQPRQYRYATTLRDPSLLRRDKETLLRAYPGFFVVPFSSLEGG